MKKVPSSGKLGSQDCLLVLQVCISSVCMHAGWTKPAIVAFALSWSALLL